MKKLRVKTVNTVGSNKYQKPEGSRVSESAVENEADSSNFGIN